MTGYYPEQRRGSTPSKRGGLDLFAPTVVDPWGMMNNFCFHVYAQKSLFIGENGNDFFWTSSAPDPLTLEFIELVPS